MVGLSFQHRLLDILFGCWIMKQPIVRRLWWTLKNSEPSIFKLWMNVTSKTGPITMTYGPWVMVYDDTNTVLSLYLYMNKIEKNRYELERTILHSSIEYSILIGSLVFWQAMNHLILPILLIRYFIIREKYLFFIGNLQTSIFRDKKDAICYPKMFKCYPNISSSVAQR